MAVSLQATFINPLNECLEFTFAGFKVVFGGSLVPAFLSCFFVSFILWSPFLVLAWFYRKPSQPNPVSASSAPPKKIVAPVISTNKSLNPAPTSPSPCGRFCCGRRSRWACCCCSCSPCKKKRAPRKLFVREEETEQIDKEGKARAPLFKQLLLPESMQELHQDLVRRLRHKDTVGWRVEQMVLESNGRCVLLEDDKDLELLEDGSVIQVKLVPRKTELEADTLSLPGNSSSGSSPKAKKRHNKARHRKSQSTQATDKPGPA
eukprot:gb/GEZN01014857.1/.p1 GENE.gb/GEZN01014857.1/~~gb/GEZN01014857.1/.p1  ORF type:complete len:272 (-),score=24.25 gb/GEZN01014857.1/:111-896(-)